MEQKISRVFSRVKHPQLRGFLIEAVEGLVKSIRLYRKGDVKNCISLWEVVDPHIDVIYNDFPFERNPSDLIGYTLVDDEEVKSILSLILALDRVYDKIGPWQPDEAYLRFPLWDEFIKAANEALEVFTENEAKVKAQNPRYWDGEENWDQVPI